MLMSLEGLIDRHQLHITGVIHAGAHLGEEAAAYHDAGIPEVWWIEGNPDIVPKLSEHVCRFPGQQVITALLGDADDRPTVFHVTNHESMSSSVLPFGTHPSFSPDTVFVEDKRLRCWTLDTVCAWRAVQGCNTLNMDLQGAELMALRGAQGLLRQIDYILTEVNVDEVYVGCAKVHELDEFLADFDRVETYMVPGQGWGDALYVRRPEPPPYSPDPSVVTTIEGRRELAGV